MSGVPPATDVLIVGGGPTGLTAALELGNRGIDCCVVEPRTRVAHDRPRAKTTNIRTMEHFRRLGVAERIREAAYVPVDWSQTAVFCTTLLGEEITRFDGILGLTPERQALFAESAQQIPQFLVEEVLRSAIEALPSVSTAWGWRLTGIEQTASSVRGSVDSEGELLQIEARYLLGSDGAGSTVRESIGATFEGEDSPRANLGIVMRAPGLADRQPHGPAVHYWTINTDQPGVMGRLDREDRWWLIASGVDDPTGTDPMAAIERMVGAAIDASVVATDPWKSRMLLADTFRDGRVFLAGDAASLNPPWGGLGFNTGVGDAVDIGWKLAAVLKGWGGPALLDSYEAERRPVHERVIRKTRENMNASPADLAEQFVEDPRNLDEATRRRAADRIQETKAYEFYSLGLVLGTRYDKSPIVVDDDEAPPPLSTTEYEPTTVPGARLPHLWLAADRSLYDALGPAYSLVVFDSTFDADGLTTAATDRAIPLTGVSLADRELGEPSEAAALLVRPDHHIAWRGDRTPSDPGRILDRITGRR